VVDRTRPVLRPAILRDITTIDQPVVKPVIRPVRPPR